MSKTYYSEALSLPYSIGAQRLLREMLSDATGVPLPADPPVRHGPVQPLRIPPRPPRHTAHGERRETVLKMLRVGPVTQIPGWEQWEVIDAVRQLRQAGYVIKNTEPRPRPARYVLTQEPTQ